jgi:hypothetical protein
MSPTPFGYNCWRVSKTEGERSVIKLLLRAMGKSFALSVPYMTKIYIEQPPSGKAIGVVKIPCEQTSRDEAQNLRAIPARLADNSEVGLRFNVNNKVEIGDYDHAVYMQPNELMYFQAADAPGEAVVVLSKVIAEDWHHMHLRAPVSKPGDEVVVQWLLGGAPQDAAFAAVPTDRVNI